MNRIIIDIVDGFFIVIGFVIWAGVIWCYWEFGWDESDGPIPFMFGCLCIGILDGIRELLVSFFFL